MEDPVTGDVQVLLKSKEDPVSMRFLGAQYISKLVKIAGITIATSRTKAKATYVTLICKNFNQLDVKTATWLERPFAKSEVFKVVIRMGKDKATGPDGFSLAFFQECWDIMKDDVMQIFYEFHRYRKFEKSLNATFIALIPKINDATKLKYFRSISLLGEELYPLDPWLVVPDKSKYLDQQSLKLQENPEDVPTGELSRNMLLSVDRHLVQTIVPGTRLTIMGTKEQLRLGNLISEL